MWNVILGELVCINPSTYPKFMELYLTGTILEKTNISNQAEIYFWKSIRYSNLKFKSIIISGFELDLTLLEVSQIHTILHPIEVL